LREDIEKTRDAHDLNTAATHIPVHSRIVFQIIIAGDEIICVAHDGGFENEVIIVVATDGEAACHRHEDSPRGKQTEQSRDLTFLNLVLASQPWTIEYVAEFIKNRE